MVRGPRLGLAALRGDQAAARRALRGHRRPRLLPRPGAGRDAPAQCRPPSARCAAGRGRRGRQGAAGADAAQHRSSVDRRGLEAIGARSTSNCARPSRHRRRSRTCPACFWISSTASSRAHDRRHALCPQPDRRAASRLAPTRRWIAWHRAREAGGTFLVRIEDIDIRRSRREFEAAILDDLQWLGLDWDGEVRRQSEHFADYGRALDQLGARGLIYPCFCSRADIERSWRPRPTRHTGPTARSIPAPAVICRIAGTTRQRSRRARSTACASTPNARRRKPAPIISSTRRWAASRASRC